MSRVIPRRFRNFRTTLRQTNEIKEHIVNHKYDFIHYMIINPQVIDEKTTITIVMTTHNRPQQTLFTLQTIQESSLHLQVTIILVDDSTQDQLSATDFQPFTFQITYITIDPKQKPWINPCVNYNLAFHEVKTESIIIQNAETFHCGDICHVVSENLTDDNYLVFDVRAIDEVQDNQIVQQLHNYDQVAPYLEQKNSRWCQHTTQKNCCFHYLTAIKRHNLLQIGGFNYILSMGSCYDDNDLIMRITRSGLKIKNIENQQYHLMGIHQWHVCDTLSIPAYIHLNYKIYHNILLHIDEPTVQRFLTLYNVA